MARPRLLFVTGKLAEPALRRLLTELAPPAAFDFEVAVLPISVVALATTDWVARHLEVPSAVERVVVPAPCAPRGFGSRSTRSIPARPRRRSKAARNSS